MSGGAVVLLLLVAAWLTWFVRDRHIKGWKRPLFRKRTYNARAAAAGEGNSGWSGGNNTGGGGGGGGAG
jgi:hypothetical protein